MRIKKTLTCLAATGSILGACFVQAAEPVGTTLKTITVTAQKQEQNIQEVPISMDVVTGMDIEDARITQMTDLTQFSPNVFSTPVMDNQSISIRGINTHVLSSNAPVGIYVNDVPYVHNRMQNPELFNIERVEVLRGPQGTLYGKNSEAGVVNIITKQPGNELTGKLFGEIGFFDSYDEVLIYRVGGNVSGPIQTDKWYLGGAFQAKYSDGYRINVYDGDEEATPIDNLTGQATVRWTPTSDWDLSFIADVSDREHGIAEQRFDSGDYATDRYEINWDGDNEWTEENNNQVIRAKYSGFSFDLLSITSRSDYRAEIKNDADLTPDDLFGNQHFIRDLIAYSQELRLSSMEDGSNLTWVVGLFGSKDEIDTQSHTPDWYNMRDTESESSSLAVFGQATYTFIERLHLTAGARYEYQELEAGQYNEYGVNSYYDISETNDEFLPKLSAAFDLTEDCMTYATFSQGFLSGGFDTSFGNNTDDLYYEPEHTTNYELGFKGSFLNNRMIVNAAVFYIDIEDKQVIEWPIGGAINERDVTNAAEASSKGFELDLKLSPLSGLDFFAGFGYTDATFGDWITMSADGSTYDYNGNQLAYVPEYTFNIGAQYRAQNGMFLRADLIGTGDYYIDTENTNKIDSREIVNLKIGYERENYDIVLWANNVLAEEYILNKYDYFGGELVTDGEPRSVGVTVTYRF